MPEGPSIVILKERLQPFKGKKVLLASGYSKIDYDRISNKKVIDFKSWGKHTIICYKGFFLRIHLLMFGSYLIDEDNERNPALYLKFTNGEVRFYTCSVKLIEGNPDDVYSWESDVMSDQWSASKAEKKIKSMPPVTVSDILLNQDVFAGVGNIIKNEVLFRVHVHPESMTNALPPAAMKAMIKEASKYSFDFYEWKKKNQLLKHLLIYKKKVCPACGTELKVAYVGKTKRLTSFCKKCQVKY